MLLMNLLKQFLKILSTVKKKKKHFNKNLIMSCEEEEQLKLSNTCWIYEKPIEYDHEKVRDYSHMTGEFKGAAHWRCNINLKITKKVSVIFHNLRGYVSHLNFS